LAGRPALVGFAKAGSNNVGRPTINFAWKQLMNLSRKLRPKTFKEVAGQTLTIRMLQNGLYLEKLFPAYLFCGQRGCGKTSTARIFAAALNCTNLEKFRKTPAQNPVPCLECNSCKAMNESRHPDFVEVDAASNTGVDNVRQILEASNYLPLLGKKKIYLIDEAHMLSKAAFNAFLKILEEPPNSVLFMLATTEMAKIPDTVRSRCFHATFSALEKKNLTEHLKTVCDNENIPWTDDALSIISEESSGSVRDALNIVEQVWTIDRKLEEETVRKALGIISKIDLIKIFKAVIDKDSSSLLNFLADLNIQNKNANSLWSGFANLLSAFIRVRLGANIEQSMFCKQKEAIFEISSAVSINRLHALNQLFWGQESQFLRTTHKHLFLEHLLVQMANQVDLLPLDEIINKLDLGKTLTGSIANKTDKHKNPATPTRPTVPQKSSTQKQTTQQMPDPIKRQAAPASPIPDAWKAIASMPPSAKFASEKSNAASRPQKPEITPNPEPELAKTADNQRKSVDFSDKELWPKANLLAEKFPGKIEISKKDS
jgi:DNA polymerase III subunit gamma/tau